MRVEQLREALRRVRRWNVERGYWSGDDAREFESGIGDAVRGGDVAAMAQWGAWLAGQVEQIEALAAAIRPLAREMVREEMRRARKGAV